MALSGALTVGPDCAGRTLAIVDGRIAAHAVAGATVLDCAAGEIAPGNVCAHTHLYSALARFGMPAPEPGPGSFIEILERVWWRLDRALDAEALEAGARDYVARALLAGTTALVDHHESPAFIEGSLAVLSGVCESLGVRALLCYGATERNGGRDEAARGLIECGRVTPTARVRGLVGLHAGFTVSDDTIVDAARMARDRGTVLHLHLSEGPEDVADARARGHEGPLERLIALDALVPGSILVHGVHLTPSQVETAAARGCWLVHNPRSNEGNGVGYANALAASERVALGTDGWDADMAQEDRALARLAAANGDKRAAGRLAAGRALIAERFGVSATGLEPGAVADVVVREGGQVRHVIVEGRVVVRDGVLVGADIGAIEAEARTQAARLWSRMAALPGTP